MIFSVIDAASLVLTLTVLKCGAQDIQQVTVTAGDDVTLSCTSATDYPKWTGPELHNGYIQQYNNDGQSSFPNPNVPEQKRLRLRWGNDRKSLIISDVIISDQGRYQCYLAMINLSVRVPPRTPVISNTDTSTDGTLIIRTSESQATSLVCISSGGYPQPLVQWYRGTTGTQPLISSSTVVNETNSFLVTQTYTFSPQRQDDGVQYICQSSFPTAPRHLNTSWAKLLLNLKPNPPTVVQTAVVAAGNQAVVRCATTGSRPAANINWSYKNTSPIGEQSSTLDGVTNTYTVMSVLKLPVTAEDNGRNIQCKVTHTLHVSPAQLTASINLDVQFSVQASSTRITGNKLTIVSGSTPLTLNCTTGSSNPASDIKWYNGSSEITNTGLIINWTGENNGQVRSQLLVFHPTRYMDGDIIRCSVSNILNSQSPVVDTITLNLQYSPLVTIEGQNQYSWTEGDNNKALTCKVQSKPVATITWFHDDLQISQVSQASNQLSYNLSPINRTHYGVYRCKANNGIGTEDEKSVTIHVKFKPLSTTITGDTNIIANGRNTVQLTCTSDSSNPMSDITWRKSSVIMPPSSNPTDINGDYGGKKSRVTLILKPTRDNDGDIISCEAHNTIGTSDRSMKTLDLRYRPLINPMSSKTYVEGGNVPFSCSASSKPVSMFKWYRHGQNDPLKEGTGTLEHNGLTYTIYNVRRTDAATYRCNANNGIETPDNKNVLLTVHYKASIVSFGVQGSVNVSSVTVDENDDVLFVCNIDSNPRSNIEIAFQDKTLYRQNMTDTLRYTHKAVTCLESGIYTCTARNQYNIGNDAIAKMELHIKCSPRPLHQMKTNFTSLLYDTATLNFTALAYPEPGMNGFVWHKQNSFTWIPLLSNADVVIYSSGLHTRLTIKNVSRSDFGHYRVTVTNEIGKYEQYIFLTETEQQKTPIETITQEKTMESTGLIISLTLGILFVTVTIYAISMTIYFKRKLILLDVQTSTQPSQRTYANLSFQTVYTDGDYSRPSTNETAAVTNDNEYSVQNYTDLHHLSNDNQRTYDVIQKT